MYASSSNPEDEGQEGHKGWLESQGSRQVHSAVGSAPRTDQALAAQGSHPVGTAPGAEPQSRSSLYPPQTRGRLCPGTGFGFRERATSAFSGWLCPRAWMYAHSNIRFIRLAMPRAWMFAHRGPHQQDPSQAPVGYAPRAGSGSADVHHTLPPTSSATQADVSTDRPLTGHVPGLTH